MPQRVVRFVALAACAALAVVGCSDGDGDVAAPSGTVPPSPTATPSPTAEIPDIPLPKRPSDEHTSDGAIAFTEYVVDVVNRMYLTGDTASLMAISTPDCPACLEVKQDIDDVYARGNRLQGGQMTLTDIGHVVIAEDVIPSALTETDFTALEELTPAGEVVDSSPAESGVALLWDLAWMDGEWRFADLRGAVE